MPNRALLALCVFTVVIPWLVSCRAPQTASSLVAGPQTSERGWTDGLTVLDDHLQVQPVSDPGLVSKAVIESRGLWRRGADEESLDLLLNTLERHGLGADGLSLLAARLERKGHSGLALAARRSALRIEPSPERQRELAMTLSRQGRRDEALVAWLAAYQADRSDAWTRGRLAVAQYFAGEMVDLELVDDAPRPLALLVEAGEAPIARIQSQDAADPTELDRIGSGSEVRIDTGGTAEAAELSMVALDDRLTVTWNDLRDAGAAGEWRLGVGTSDDGGATWSDFLLRPLDPNDAVFEGDPMTAVDARTGNRWVGAIEFGGGGSVYVARQRTDGTFDAPVETYQGSTDKCWMAAGPIPGVPASTRVYVAYNFPNVLQRSSDLGATWSTGVDLDADGIAFLPRVMDDGTLHLGYTELKGDVLGPGVRLQTSLDGGVTVGAPRPVLDRMDFWGAQDGSRFPGQFRVAALPILAISPVDGSLYFVYVDTTAIRGGDADVDIYLTRSIDGGGSWSSPTIIAGGPAVAGDQFMPWLEIDQTGRLHMVFFDSRHTPQADDVLDGRLDVYYSTSGDGGDSWTELRLTDQPFSTLNIFWPGLDQFIGDYLALAVGDDEVWVAYPRVDETGGDLDLFVRRLTQDLIFVDGFESGDASGWSVAVGF